MESKTLKQNEFNPKLGFEIKNPLWTFWVCLLAMIGCLATFLVFLYLKWQNIITESIFYIGYIFLGVFLLSAVGVYAWVYEKLTYSDGVYKYYKAFGKNEYCYPKSY